MCISPIRLPTGVVVACNTCRLCRSNRVKDFVGRCIAEQHTSKASYAVTLTYAGDVVHATSLYYLDVRRMLQRLRNDGFDVRYICAGEHGEQKGRAHWHCCLFFPGAHPELPIDRRFEWGKYWPHGFAYAQHSGYEGFSYLLKYTLKEDENRNRAHRKAVRLSKYPPLGYAFFRELAGRMVAARVALHSPEYSFASVLGRGPDGRYRPRKFWLTGRSFELFAEAYVEGWKAAYGSPPPDSDFLWSSYYDPLARLEAERDEDAFAVRLRERRPDLRAMHSEAVQLGFLLLPAPHTGLVVRYSDQTARVIIGDESWQVDVGVGSLRSALQRVLPKSLASVAGAWLDPKRLSYSSDLVSRSADEPVLSSSAFRASGRR